MHRFPGHDGGVLAVSVLVDNRRALSGGDDGTLRLWDLESGTQLHRFEGHEDWVWTVAVLADNRRALSGGSDRILRLWDLDSGQMLATVHFDAALTALAIDSQDRRQSAMFSGNCIGSR